jgi:hypothetical protein
MVLGVSSRQHVDVPRLPLLLLMLVWGGLAAYLHSGVPWDGDGAVYTLQALDGTPWERSLHAGYLGPLTAWAQGGLPPATFGWLWGPIALLLSTVLGAQFLARCPRDPHLPPGSTTSPWAPLIAPAVLLGASASWRATGTVEVYGPLATLLLGAAVALGARRPLGAAVLLAWAAAAHPGAWALVPGVLLLAGDDRRTASRAAAGALVLYAILLAALWPDWWSGGRGLVDLPPSDQSPGASLQAAWRLLARDLGPVAVVLLAGACTLPARAAMGLGLVLLGAAAGLDRFSDNPGQLPTLWLAAGAAPLAVRWIEDLGTERHRRLAGLGLVVLLVLGVAEATTRHDADVRAMDRETAALREAGCDQTGLEWRNQARLKLLCRDR